jgi:pimeloyl-ACP methyl ester carboxylesterase
VNLGVIMVNVSSRMWTALLSLLLIGASASAFPPITFSQEPFAHPQRLIDVGAGRRINIYCMGSGSPAVVLDLGWGDPLIAWAWVQPTIAKFTRVCSYERAGYGFSDPGPLPRNTAAIVRTSTPCSRARE